MKAIVYNHPETQIPLVMESLCLRAAYLLCEHATLAGSSYTVLLFDRMYSPKRLEEKIELIDQYSKSSGEEFLEGGVEQIKKTLKFL